MTESDETAGPVESRRSLIQNVWVPIVGSVSWMSLSGFLQYLDPERGWFSRSGAIMTIAAIYLGFHESKQSMQYVDPKLYINNELFYKPIALIMGIIGAIIWAYGDLLIKLI